MQKLRLFSIFLVVFTCLPLLSQAQELHQNLQGSWKAKVLNILSEENKIIPGTETKVLVQEIEAKILEGEKKGEIITLENDYLPLEIGDTFFLNYLITIDGQELFSVRDVNRIPFLIFLAVVFGLVIIALGRFQGVKVLLSLLGAIFVVIFVLIPLLLKGYPPVLTSVIISSVVLFLAIFLTHGFSRESTSAFLGTVFAVTLTGILAFISVKASKLTGFSSDEAVYLNFATFGQLDFSGLLLAAIIIGILGVLDDIATTQSAVVSELFTSNPALSRKEIYKRALRVGREHASALVNTLALAYAGAALPLLLLFSAAETNLLTTVNQEIVATEVVRTIVGSIGLILTIPLTTLLAVFFLKNQKGRKIESRQIH